jgi:hypothetical protein
VLLLEEQMKNSSVTVVVSHLNAPLWPGYTPLKGLISWVTLSALWHGQAECRSLSKKEQTENVSS